MRRRYTPQERQQRAREDYHDPAAGIGGAPPVRCCLTLRLIPAAFGLLACTAGAVVFLVAVSQSVIAAVWAFFAATAEADMAVVPRVPPPVYVSGFGEKSASLAGRIADGTSAWARRLT